ncbi:MAG: DUF6326 family protein [Sulfitobacter sp.]
MSSKHAFACAEPVDVRFQLSALWTSILFIFAYVDLFSLYRPDVRAGLDAGKVAVFEVSETFLLAVTLYVTIPSLMVFLCLVMAPRVNRIANIVIAVLYAITIAGAAIGEWHYYVFGSVLEVILLCWIVVRAYKWPRVTV